MIMLLLFELLGIRLKYVPRTQEWETVLGHAVNTSLASAFFFQSTSSTGANLNRWTNLACTPVEIALVIFAMKYDLARTLALDVPFAVSDIPVRFDLTSAMTSDELFLSYATGSSFEVTGDIIEKYKLDESIRITRDVRYTIRVKANPAIIVLNTITYSTSGRDVLATARNTRDGLHGYATTTFGTGTERALIRQVAGKLNTTEAHVQALIYPYLLLGKLNDSTINRIPSYLNRNSETTLVSPTGANFPALTVTFGTVLHDGVDDKFPHYGVNFVRKLTNNVGTGMVDFPLLSDNIEGSSEFVVEQARLVRASSVIVIPPGVIRSSIWFGTYDGIKGTLNSCWLSIPLLVEVQRRRFLASSASTSMSIRPFEVGFGSPVRIVFTTGSSGNADLSGFVTTVALNETLRPIYESILTIVPIAKIKDLISRLAPVYYGDKNGKKKRRRR